MNASAPTIHERCADELAVARWLEPQHALLHLPTGKLCIESTWERFLTVAFRTQLSAD